MVHPDPYDASRPGAVIDDRRSKRNGNLRTWAMQTGVISASAKDQNQAMELYISFLESDTRDGRLHIDSLGGMRESGADVQGSWPLMERDQHK